MRVRVGVRGGVKVRVRLGGFGFCAAESLAGEHDPRVRHTLGGGHLRQG